MTDSNADAAFVRRVLIVCGLAALAGLLFLLADLLVLVVAAIVLAVVLRTAADLITHVTLLSEKWAVAATVLTVIATLVLLSWLAGPQIADQVSSLFATLPSAWAKLTADVQGSTWGGLIIANLEDAGVYAARFTAQVPLFALGVVGAIVNVVLVVVGGIMIAMEPRSYRDGLLMLFPKGMRASVGRALNASGLSLKGWLLAQLASMTIIGLLTGIGLTIVGVPSALGLGLFAGLAQFVPYVGPFVSAIPGLMIAAATSWDIFLWAAVIYAGVQQFEDNLISPWLQKHIAGIPMALSLFAIVAFGILFGPLGVILATPLTLITLVMVRSLYIRDVLGEQVRLPGEAREAPASSPKYF